MSEIIDKEAVIDMLQQLTETLERVQWSFSTVPEPDFFYASIEGQDKLDAIGMKLYPANLALLCVFAVKFPFFNRKVRKGMRKGRKRKTSNSSTFTA